MKKLRKIAKRLRARAEELHHKAFDASDAVGKEDKRHWLLLGDALREVADQLSPRPKKKQKADKKAAKAAKKTQPKTAKQENAPSNGSFAVVGTGG